MWLLPLHLRVLRGGGTGLEWLRVLPPGAPEAVVRQVQDGGEGRRLAHVPCSGLPFERAAARELLRELLGLDAQGL